MSSIDGDPIEQEDGKWFWWNEVWSDRFGPYDTEGEAREACLEYCKKELGI
jgi:hypothetical protein